MMQTCLVLLLFIHLGFSVRFVYDYEIGDLKERSYIETYLADNQNEREFTKLDANYASAQTKEKEVQKEKEKEVQKEKEKEEEKEKRLLKVLMRLKRNF